VTGSAIVRDLPVIPAKAGTQRLCSCIRGHQKSRDVRAFAKTTEMALLTPDGARYSL
jgi:hypothetical protein